MLLVCRSQTLSEQSLIAFNITERPRLKSLVTEVSKSRRTLTNSLVIMSVKYYERGIECRHSRSTVSLVTSVFQKYYVAKLSMKTPARPFCCICLAHS